MTIIILGKANTLSSQLAAIQKLGVVKSGPEIMEPLPIRSGGPMDGRRS